MLIGIVKLALGDQHSMILKRDGSVWATGDNLYGQLGDRWTAHSNVFMQVISDGAKAIAAGGFHSMVLKQDGSIWATGSNKDGQFGDGSTTSEKTFVRVAPFSNGVEHNHTHRSIFMTLQLLKRAVLHFGRSVLLPTCAPIFLLPFARCFTTSPPQCTHQLNLRVR